jgi:uncharacterized protein (TIGR00255 family)
MIKSMTGFASLTREDEQATVGVTVRSVNHRFLDLQMRLPASLAEMEPRLRAMVQARIGRGRIELAIALQLRRQPTVDVELNEALLDALAAALDRARAKGVVSGPLQPGDLLRIPQALTVRDKVAAGDGLPPEVRASVEGAVASALDELNTMRAREGSFLRADLDTRRALLADLLDRAAGAADRGRAALEARLADRIREIGAEGLTDAAVIAQEIVRFAARSDITEEVVRFRSHLTHWQTLSDAPEPCGRKLDFLLQEMNREVNTIGSKAEGDHAPALIVAMKAELEKLREQVQNVE